MIRVTWSTICDICGKVHEQEKDSYPWEDEMLEIPEGWLTDLFVPEEYREHPCWDICDACPECQVKPDWVKYKERIDENKDERGK